MAVDRANSSDLGGVSGTVVVGVLPAGDHPRSKGLRHLMRKLIYRAFGGVDVLELAYVPVPNPAAGEVLVRVEAAAINPADWKLREGRLKFVSGWRMPQGQGLEFAGVVEQVGRGVTDYAVGDAVFGAAIDSIAEYCVAKVGSIAKKPPEISFVVAATIPCAGTTAASTFDRVRVEAGTEVLVNGATGGIGMFVTQMAVRRGANVTAVVSDKGIATAQRWGAARVVNYRSTNILDRDHPCDIIVELSNKLPFKQAKTILRPGGTFVASLPNPAELLPGLLGNLVSSRKYAFLAMRAKHDALAAVASEVATGGLEVLIGETVALEGFRDAYARAAAGRVLGKSVFVMNEQGEPR